MRMILLHQQQSGNPVAANIDDIVDADVQGGGFTWVSLRTGKNICVKETPQEVIALVHDVSA